MPNRIIREGILSSEAVCSLSWPEEVFYRRLLSVVDDYGLFYAQPKLLRAACYPLQIDKVSDSDIGKWLTSCVEAALVRVYPASDGKRYLQVMRFNQQVRAKTTKFPPPPLEGVADAVPLHSTCIADAQHPPADAHLDVDVFVDESSGRKRPARPLKKPIPDDFGISDRVRKWAAEKGHRHLEARLEAFVSTSKKQGYVYADWDEAFMEAIRKDWAQLNDVVPLKLRRVD